MKNYILVLIFIFSNNLFSQNQNIKNNDSIKLSISNLEKQIEIQKLNIDSIFKISNTNNYILDVKDWDGKIKYFNKEESKWNIILKDIIPSILPILLALFGGVIALIQINRQSKYTLIHNKANNISQARIKWIQDFRDLLCSFIGEVTIVNYHLSIVIEENKAGKKDEAREKYDSIADKIKDCRILATKISLFLNTDYINQNHNDSDHNLIEKLSDQFMESALTYDTINEETDFNKISKEMVKIAKKILKETWEQAKKEGDDELSKLNKGWIFELFK